MGLEAALSGNTRAGVPETAVPAVPLAVSGGGQITLLLQINGVAEVVQNTDGHAARSVWGQTPFAKTWLGRNKSDWETPGEL